MEKIRNEKKDYDELIKNEITEDYIEFSDNDEFDYNKKEKYYISNNNETNLKKFKVFLYFEINGNNKYVFPIETDFFNIEKQHIYELLKNIVKKINNKNIIINYKNINYMISLKDCEDNDKNFYIKNYELKPCKKTNFIPKNYLPSFSSTSLLKNIINERLSFVSKNNLNIMLIEKIDDF